MYDSFENKRLVDWRVLRMSWIRNRGEEDVGLRYFIWTINTKREKGMITLKWMRSEAVGLHQMIQVILVMLQTWSGWKRKAVEGEKRGR